MTETAESLPQPGPAGDPHKGGNSAETLTDRIRIDRRDLRFTFVRAQGPGGQSVNKVSTAAQLRVAVRALRGLSAAAANRLRDLAGRRLTREDELILVSRRHRSQLDNRRACIERLRDLVARAAKPPVPRKKTKPTRASKQRRLDAKKKRSETKSLRRRPDE